MKIVVLTVNQIYSNKIIKDLILNFPKEVKLILESQVILKNHSQLAALKIYLQKSGLYYTFVQALKLELYKIISSIFSLFFKDRNHHKLSSYKILAKKFGIKIQKVVNINNQESRQKLALEKPDLIISVFFNQILTPPIINIPKLGVLNIHPAYLPSYKGISPTFWALSNGEKTSGVSIHYINDRIDSGEIIARQKIKILKDESEDSLYWRASLIGSSLLKETIKNLKSGKIKKVENKKGSYYSIPTKTAVKAFKKNGHSFFNFFDYLLKN